jgi:integrase
MKGKVLRPALWPEADQAAWVAAFDEGDVFDGRGPAAHWSAGSRRSVASGYGRWIGYLTGMEPGTLTLAPADRVTRERLRRYLDHLAAHITPAGVFNYPKHLYDPIRVMAPERDWRWLKTLVWRLDRGTPRRNKAGRMVTPDRLIRLGDGLMQQARPESNGLDAAIAYRNGLIIALLSRRPVRRRNLAALRIGRHLVQSGGRWHIVFRADETKNRQPYEATVPERLQPYLERYLSEIRPRFLGAAEHDGLWASAKGGPMTETAIYEQVSKRTKAAFGKAINLHLFRDIAVTEIAYKDPARIGIARDLLGHSDLRAVDRHYNQASQIRAGRAYHEALLAERLDLTQTGHKRGRRR